MKRVTSEGCSAERRRETDGSVAVTRALDSVRKQNILDKDCAYLY